MQIKDIINEKGEDVVSFLRETKVSEVAATFSSQSIGAAIIGDPENGVLGVVSERDICRGVGDFGAELPDMRIEELMTRDIIIGDLDWDCAHALDVMLSNNIRHLPIIDEELDLVGLISMRDLAAITEKKAA